MKNIHILPTEKSSRLLKRESDGKLFLYKKLKDNNKFVHLRCQNIYIVSDEEIKKGDFIYSIVDNMVYKVIYSENNIIQSFFYSHYLNQSKKIVLTTNQELISDGVQAIDDEFLEWFVKNPSCEYIEIENVYDKFLNGDKRSVSDFRKKYKINIPKEELKQCDICKMYPRLEGTNKCESCYSAVRHFLEQNPEFKDSLLPDLRKKQETLEEITEQIQKDCHKFVESIISKVTYQDATNTFLFMKLAELTLKLKKYE